MTPDEGEILVRYVRMQKQISRRHTPWSIERDALLLGFVASVGAKEAAFMLGISPVTVWSRLRRLGVGRRQQPLPVPSETYPSFVEAGLVQ